MKYKIFAKSKDGVYVDCIYSTFFKDYEQGDILIKGEKPNPLWGDKLEVHCYDNI